MPPRTGPVATSMPLAAPYEGSRMAIPGDNGVTEPVFEDLHVINMLTSQLPSFDDALHRFGHVEPGAGVGRREQQDAVLGTPLHKTVAAMATCGIRPPVEAFENTQSRLLLLADSEEEEYNLKHTSAHLYTGRMNTVQRILTCIKRLIGLCLQSLHHRFVAWTKPDTTSLLLGTLTDLARSKSELVAENAFLRKPLIILRRQVKRPACTKTDRMLLVLLARAVRTWKQALFIAQPETLLQWHRQGCAPVLEVQVQSSIFQTKDTRRNRGFDHGNGRAESALGSGTDPWRITQAGHLRLQSTIQKYMRHTRMPRRRGQNWATFLQNHAQDIWACDALAGHRPLLSLAVCLLHDRYAIS